MKKTLFSLVFMMLLAGAVSAQQVFMASLTGAQEVPSNNSAGKGTCKIVLNSAQNQITVNCTFSGLGTNANAAHIHGNGAVGVNAGILFGFTGVPAATSGTIGPLNFAVTPAQVANMRAHLHYVNIHSTALPGGELRGQIKQAHTVFDSDGDGRTDVTTFRQSTNQFWVMSSLDGSSTIYTHGTGAGDIWLNNTCDFDGDGKGDPLLLKLNASNIANWSILQTGTNTVRNVEWGNFSVGVLDTLAIADYDGDGIQDPAVYRRSNGDWWVIRSTDAVRSATKWGTTNDFPSIGDYDGDGKADMTVVRVESGQRVWYTLRSSDGASTRTVFGTSATDGVFFFVPFDVDGDGKQDLMVNRTVSGQRQFHILRSSDGFYLIDIWGAAPASTPLFGDYDGDGKTDLVARQTNGTNLFWWIKRSSDGLHQYATYGLPNDQLTEEGEFEEFEKSLQQSN